MATCLVNPCRFSTCAAFPDAICAGNFCDKCSARWFDGEGNEVTSRCGTGMIEQTTGIYLQYNRVVISSKLASTIM